MLLTHITDECVQMMNEPHRGYIDLPSLHGFDYNTELHLGDIRAYTLPCSFCEFAPFLTKWARNQPPPCNLSSSARAIRPM